jgi:DNA-binding CsgD family transcriptional regulator
MGNLRHRSAAPPVARQRHQPDSVFIADVPSGEIIFSNRYAETVVGRRLSELADDYPMFHLDVRPYSFEERQLPRTIASGDEIVDEDFFGPAPGGGRIRWRCNCVPVHDGDGRVVAAIVFSQDVTERSGQPAARPRDGAERRAIAELTARELEILQALAEGLDGQAVADRLGISRRTERNHVAHILAKLGVNSRLQALVVALRNDIVELR